MTLLPMVIPKLRSAGVKYLNMQGITNLKNGSITKISLNIQKHIENTKDLKKHSTNDYNKFSNS